MNNNYQEVDLNQKMDQQNQSLNQNNNYQDMNNNQNNNYHDMNNNQNNNYQDMNDNQNVQPGLGNVQYYDQNNNEQYDNSNGGFDNYHESLWSKIKIPVFIVVAVIILIILIILIVKGCSSSAKKHTPTDPTDGYKNEYNILSTAADNYFFDNQDLAPKAIGECSSVSLGDLTNAEYITADSSEKLNTCDNNDTVVRVCKLESGNYNYNVDFSCTNSDLSANYDETWQEGTENNLNTNADVKFTFLAQETTVSDAVAGTEEELWKDEITYPEGSYTLITSKSYYRYRDATWHWSLDNNYYYPSNTTNVNSATAYYTSAPSGYTNQGSSATVYKWYVNSHQKYPSYESIAPDSNYVIRGAEGPSKVVASADIPPTFTYRTIKSGQTIYSTRALTKTESLTTTLYKCSNSIGQWQSGLTDACGSGESKSLPITIGYKCYYDNSTIAKNDNSGVDEEGYQQPTCKTKIYTYGAWNPWQVEACDITSNEPILCRKTVGYIYTDRVWEWFTQAKKTYYPSGSENSNGENTYYAQAPVANAIKDSTTSTTAYKWYKTESKDLGYSKTSPAEGAIKGEQTYSAWSDYSLTKPSNSSNRQIEEREKVTLTRTPSEGGINKTDITNGYVTEEEMIETLKQKGYNVNTLSDVLALENISYKIKLYYKNVK